MSICEKCKEKEESKCKCSKCGTEILPPKKKFDFKLFFKQNVGLIFIMICIILYLVMKFKK